MEPSSKSTLCIREPTSSVCNFFREAPPPGTRKAYYTMDCREMVPPAASHFLKILCAFAAAVVYWVCQDPQAPGGVPPEEKGVP